MTTIPPLPDKYDQDSNLTQHAWTELHLAGLIGGEPDSIYGDMLGEAVMDLIKLFASQGHSGMSGGITLHVFREVANFNALTPPTNNPAEWNDVGNGMWQNRRQSDSFSTDGGKTYYRLDDRDKIVTAEQYTP